MIKGDHGPPKLLHAFTCGTLEHASHAPQVRACNYSGTSELQTQWDLINLSLVYRGFLNTEVVQKKNKTSLH